MPTKKKVIRRRPKRVDRAALKAREVAIIADLRAGHLSYRKIAAKHGVSLPTVNAKARKAGIRRPKGRRPAVAAKVAAAKSRQTKAPVAAVAARSARPGTQKKSAAAPAVLSVKRKRAKSARRAAAKPITRGVPFADAFRQMVLQYFPSLTLAKFDRLSKLISKEVG